MLEHKDRIVSIDVLKGVSILLIILSHISKNVLVLEWKWLYHLLFMILDVFGVSMFIFLSCLGVIFSVKKGGKNNVIRKALVLLGIVFIINSFGMKMGILSFWFWGVIQFIAIGQVLTCFIIRIRIYQRIIIVFLLLYIVPIFFDYITGNMAVLGIDYKSLGLSDLKNVYSFIFWIFFYPAYQSPFLPYIIIVIIGSIIGENMVLAYDKTLKGDIKIYKIFNKNLFIYGLFMVMIGILFGFTLQSTDFGFNILSGINESLFIEWIGLPEFLLHGSIPNILYNIGIAILLLCLSFLICEIHRHKGRIIKFLVFYGRFSLSLFILHRIFCAIFIDSMQVGIMFLYVFFVIVFLGFVLYEWIHRLNGIGTIEWIIVVLSNLYKKNGDR